MTLYWWSHWFWITWFSGNIFWFGMSLAFPSQKLRSSSSSSSSSSSLSFEYNRPEKPMEKNGITKLYQATTISTLNAMREEERNFSMDNWRTPSSSPSSTTTTTKTTRMTTALPMEHNLRLKTNEHNTHRNQGQQQQQKEYDNNLSMMMVFIHDGLASGDIRELPSPLPSQLERILPDIESAGSQDQREDQRKSVALDDERDSPLLRENNTNEIKRSLNSEIYYNNESVHAINEIPLNRTDKTINVTNTNADAHDDDDDNVDDIKKEEEEEEENVREMKTFTNKTGIMPKTMNHHSHIADHQASNKSTIKEMLRISNHTGSNSSTEISQTDNEWKKGAEKEKHWRNNNKIGKTGLEMEMMNDKKERLQISVAEREENSEKEDEVDKRMPFTLENTHKEEEEEEERDVDKERQEQQQQINQHKEEEKETNNDNDNQQHQGISESEPRTRKSKGLSAEYSHHIPHFINYSKDAKGHLTEVSAPVAPLILQPDTDHEIEGNVSSEALSVQRAYFMDAGAISAICFTIFGVCCVLGSVSVILYRRRFLNKPHTLSEPDSSVYIDDSTMRDNSDEMYSLDNDSFLNSLEAMTIQNYWTDTVKHTKL